MSGEGDVDVRLSRFQASQSSASTSNGKGTIASTANALEVYEDAVQEPLLECTNLAGMYYNAQEIGSRRPQAKVLREDFCSSAIVAQTWLGLDKENRAQGVDIDYDALVVAHRRISRTKKGARLIQSAQHSSNGKVRVVDVEGGLPEDSSMDEANRSINSGASTPTSTWDNGAASDRFERRFLAKKAKAQLAEAKSRASTPERKKEESPLDEDVLTLLHADVLSLPLDGIDVELPDLVYAGNYALSYFHDRKSLLGYLQQCRRTLRTETGVLIVDPFAGPTNWEPSNDDERREQDDLWSQFASESGFLRSEQDDPPVALKGDDLEFWKAKQPSTSGSDWRAWPRGRLILVRSGHLNGGYEYWREDGPIDYTTNRFRMSLSFRFTKDKSWARDYFSYDFRVWSLREITEAMEEVGFERIEVHAIPRLSSQDDVHSQKSDTSDTDSDNGIDEDEEMSKADGNHNDGMDGKNGLMQRTEKQESGKITFQHLEPDQKLFAAKSFGTYIIACMPSINHSDKE